jgi:hypothetical protein
MRFEIYAAFLKHDYEGLEILGFSPNKIWQHGLDCSFLFPWLQKKNRYLQIIGMNLTFSNDSTLRAGFSIDD